MTTAGRFCNRTVVVAERDDSVLTAARRMREHHVGSIVVVEHRDGRTVPVGMVTDRDIVVGVVATAPEQLDRISVGDIMGSKLIKAYETEPLLDVLETMRTSGVRRVPIVADDESLVGIIALDDVVSFLAEQLDDVSHLLVREQETETRRRP